MPIDSLTGEEYPIHKGVTFVKTDGTVLHFASAKNRKNYFMKRRKLRWVNKGKVKRVVLDKQTADEKKETAHKKG